MTTLNKRNTYNNNFNLKKTGVELEYTPEQIEEIIKCKKDIFYFASTYVRIVTLDKGEQNFRLYNYQKDIINKIKKNRFTVILAGRQCGKSITCLLPILHGIIFKNNWTAAILANKKENAIKLLDRLKKMYEALPVWLKQGTKEWAKGFIELENNSKVIAEATTPNAGRSFSINYLFLDEFAVVPNNMANEFYSATYPTISSGNKTKIVISSTPLGFNLFHKIYMDAVHKRNGYVPIKVTWDKVPGRDKTWKEETLKNIGEEKFRVEYECEFLGSSNTLIDVKVLDTLTHSAPIKVENGVYYYKEPQPKNLYMMTLDAAEGFGMDATAFTVIDVTRFPYEVVCCFESDKIRPLEVPALMFRIGKYYNDAYILCEINYAPEIPFTLFHEYEYSNLLSTTNSIGQQQQALCSGFGNNIKLGLKTSTQTKRFGCNMIKDMVENQKIILNDERLISQLTTFSKSGNSYAAEDGYKDDIVSSMIVFGWATTQPYYRELVRNSIRESLLKDYEIDNTSDYPSLGVIPAPYFEKNIVADGSSWEVVATITNHDIVNSNYSRNKNTSFWDF